MKVYPPWQLFAWWVAFGAQAPRAFDVGGMIPASGGVAAALVAVLGRGDRHSASSPPPGPARWANSEDVVSAGLRAAPGTFLGRFDGGYRRNCSTAHSIEFAPYASTSSRASG